VRRPSSNALATLAMICVALSSARPAVVHAQDVSPAAMLGPFCAILTPGEVTAAIKVDVSIIAGDEHSCRFLDISSSSSLTGFFVSQRWGTLADVRTELPTAIDVAVSGQPALVVPDGSLLVIQTDRGVLTLQLLGSTGEGADAATALETLAATAMGRLAAIQLVPPLSVWNDTDIPIAVVLNGSTIAHMDPGTEHDPLTIAVPPTLPWTVEATSSDGFVLATALVASTRPVSYRFDLSCGRIDIWSRVPILGPMNGPGHPGDCGP
jgi:hypothetical protein